MTPHQPLARVIGANRGGIGKAVGRQLTAQGFAVLLAATVASANRLEMKFQAHSRSQL